MRSFSEIPSLWRLPNLFQLRVLRFRSDENGNIRVSVLPKREEILIGRFGFGSVALQDVGASEAQVR
jgi:hypothetical protein